MKLVKYRTDIELVLFLHELTNKGDLEYGVWDCFCLVNEIRKFFELKLIPVPKYDAQTLIQNPNFVEQQCEKLGRKKLKVTFSNFDIIYTKNHYNNGCLATYYNSNVIVLSLYGTPLIVSASSIPVLGIYEFN